MKEILREHIARYPHLQVVDAVKLLYQSEFGGGHMISNPARSLRWIEMEWKQVKLAPYDQVSPLLEDIGCGICRVCLDALYEGLAPETLNKMFVKTADRTTGTVESFEKKLDVLRELCAAGETPFGMEELEEYLSEYKKEGYPPVSHSDIYRKHYYPSYRVVATSYTRYFEVFRAIDRAMAEAEEECPIILAIDGMCGSGKSTLGRILEEIYDCNLFHMDDFFLRPEQRTPKRLAEPGGNVDYERFKEEVLDHIGDPDGFSYQVYSCGKQALDGVVKVPYKQLNIVEGAYSQHPYFGEAYDLKFMCKISPEEQINRILKRNGAEMMERFKAVWIPMENRYFEEFGVEKESILI